MFFCNKDGVIHPHFDVDEIRDCWKAHLATVWVSPGKPDSSMYGEPTYKYPSGSRATVGQVQYIKDLGGDWTHAKYNLSTGEASALIKTLIKAKREPASIPPPSVRPAPSGTAVDLGAPTHPMPSTPAAPTYQRRESIFEGPFMDLLKKVPQGYFAVREEEGSPITFLRVSVPARGKMVGRIKVQTQHGANLDTKWILEPDGTINIFSGTIEETMLLLITNYRESAMLYAQELGRCARCNVELTVERSRWLTVGPECEKYWPWALEMRREQAEMNGENIKF